MMVNRLYSIVLHHYIVVFAWNSWWSSIRHSGSTTSSGGPCATRRQSATSATRRLSTRCRRVMCHRHGWTTRWSAGWPPTIDRCCSSRVWTWRSVSRATASTARATTRRGPWCRATGGRRPTASRWWFSSWSPSDSAYPSWCCSPAVWSSPSAATAGARTTSFWVKTNWIDEKSNQSDRPSILTFHFWSFRLISM